MIENGPCHITKKAVNHNPKHMLPVVDWLSDVPKTGTEGDLVEVQFKNTRKGYYHNAMNLPLEKGVKVVVEANPGMDLGEVTLTGELVALQMKALALLTHLETQMLQLVYHGEQQLFYCLLLLTM